MDIGTATSLGQFLTHLLVESRHDGIARIILHIVVCAWDGDRRSLRRSDTQHIDTHASILRSRGSLHCPTLMVLTIGDDNDGTPNAFLGGKAVSGHVDGTPYIRTLGGYHRGIDARKEHLRRYIVARDRQLHEGVACKDDESDLIVRKVVDEVLYHHLTAVETTRHDILCQHGVTDVHTDDGLDAHTLLLADLRSHLRTGEHQHQQSQGTLENPELHRRTETRHIGHEFLEQGWLTKLTQPFLLISVRDEADECQYGYQHQQPEIYGVFKSKHYGILLNIVIRNKISSNRARTAARAKG